MLLLKGIVGGSLKITSENINNFRGAKNSLKRFLGFSTLSTMPVVLPFRNDVAQAISE